uniref:ATP synthase subunit a n=1 Tax=Bryozoa sp. TaxID=2813608 RepID=A0AAU8L1C5_9BILA
MMSMIIFLQVLINSMDKINMSMNTLNVKKILSGQESALILIFSVMMISNLMGLSMSVYSITVAILCNAMCAMLIMITIWLSSFIYDINMFFKKVNILTTSKQFSLFLAMIEFVSFFIRPITLMTRLSANIIAGHVIMSLIMLSKGIYLYSTGILLMLFESFVSIIQAYIFITLIKMYSE